MIVNEQIVVTIDGEKYEGKLGRVESTHLGREDHGIPTAYIRVAGDGWGQSAGGYCLKGEAMFTFVMGVLDALGVDTWEQVKGRQVVVLAKPGESHYKLAGIKPAVGGKPFLFGPAMEALADA